MYASTTIPNIARLLRRPVVQEMTGLSRSIIYAKMADGSFPRPVQIAARAVAWKESDILNWMQQLPEAGEVQP